MNKIFQEERNFHYFKATIQIIIFIKEFNKKNKKKKHEKNEKLIRTTLLLSRMIIMTYI